MSFFNQTLIVIFFVFVRTLISFFAPVNDALNVKKMIAVSFEGDICTVAEAALLFRLFGHQRFRSW